MNKVRQTTGGLRLLPYFYIIIILLLAAWLRLWQLNSLPPGIWFDESFNIMDILWMLEKRAPQIFLPANNGREPLYHYLGALMMLLFGVKPYVFRLTAVFAGLLTIPLLYRWLSGWFDDRWLGVYAAAGLAFSFWHVMMSRIGLRAILFPLLVVITVDLFWQGVTRRSWLFFGLAGVALGLNQYTYLSARIFPLLFILFPLIWLVVCWTRGPAAQTEGIIRPTELRFWLYLALMGLVAVLVFLPLGLYFWQHPGTFMDRAGEMSIIARIPTGQADIGGHLLRSLRLFVDGYHPSWRLDVVGRPAFDGLSLVGFWVGFVVSLRYAFRPRYLFLLLGLLVLWLPAFLSIDPIHSLRESGLLVFFYTVVGVGLVTIARLLSKIGPNFNRWSAVTVGALLILVSGGRTAYDYFVRWPAEPEVAWRYDGQLVDLINQLVAESVNADIVLPFPVYAHPTSRVLLRDYFEEVGQPPPVDVQRPTLLVTVPDVETLSETRFFVEQDDFENVTPQVWLHRGNAGEKGTAFISQPINIDKLDLPVAPTPLFSSGGNQPLALLYRLPNFQPIRPYFFDIEQLYPVAFDFGQQLRLTGYQVSPAWVEQGQTPAFRLAWQSLTGQPIAEIPFVQIINGRGEPVSQLEGPPMLDKLFRWRQNGIIRTEYPLWLGSDIPAGAYLVRLGLFKPSSGERLPIRTQPGAAGGDQLVLGLFYVTAEPTDPRQPQRRLDAHLGDQIQLRGYSLPPTDNPALLPVKLHWQAAEAVNTDYTAFVQLLDGQNQFVTGWDSQPFTGLYPTSRWQPGELVVDRFDLQLPPGLPSGDYRLVTGMYNFDTGERLPAFTAAGEPLVDNLITLTEITYPR